jgi:hypothetical protein
MPLQMPLHDPGRVCLKASHRAIRLGRSLALPELSLFYGYSRQVLCVLRAEEAAGGGEAPGRGCSALDATPAGRPHWALGLPVECVTAMEAGL